MASWCELIPPTQSRCRLSCSGGRRRSVPDRVDVVGIRCGGGCWLGIVVGGGSGSGLVSKVIMPITGHRTVTAFIDYIKVGNEEGADMLAENEYSS